jgi:methylmalonyl-CoA/ethylmalonyl-CoA epimerase
MEKMMLKKISHIGIAVNNIEEAAKFYRDILGLTLSDIEMVVPQKTRAGIFKISESNIELVEPAAPDSPLVKFLETKGQGIHHICFEVDDVESEVKLLLEKGATMIDQKSRPGAHNTKVAFVHPKSSSGVLIELCELPKKG